MCFDSKTCFFNCYRFSYALFGSLVLTHYTHASVYFKLALTYCILCQQLFYVKIHGHQQWRWHRVSLSNELNTQTHNVVPLLLTRHLRRFHFQHFDSFAVNSFRFGIVLNQCK